MTAEENTLKRDLAAGRLSLGIWCSLASPMATEVVAGAGAGWLLIDMEHAPNHTAAVLAQLHAASGYPVEPVVRVPSHDPVVIKRMLDMGARSLMVPNVATAEQAREIVAATRYPPSGHRGISVMQRGNRFGRWKRDPGEGVFLALQAETQAAVDNAEAIAAVRGVDAVFVGPADLSAALGHTGQPGAEAVQRAIRRVVEATTGAGKAAGILAFQPADAGRYIDWGCRMVAVGSDLNLLARGTDALVADWRERRPRD